MRDGRHHARRIVRRLWPRFGGARLTVCAAAILELVSGTALRVPRIIIDITNRKIAELASRVELHEAGRP